MNTRKLTQLAAVLIAASFLIIGATQKFDTILAKNVITTSSSGVAIKNAGTLSLASGEMTLAAGDLAVTAGNLVVGNGTPTFTQDGEDAYVEGVLEAASDVIMGAQSTISVVFGIPITPTGWYQPIESADFGAGDGQVVTPIAAPSGDTNGTRLLLYNINASQVITIDGTGTTVECKADVILAPTDTLELFWNGDDWKCISNYDNS